MVFVVGSAATLVAGLLTARCKKKWLAPLPPVAANMVLVGLVLAYEQAGTSAAFWPTYAFNALTVGLGEAVACYALGGLLLWRLDKSNALQRYLQNRLMKKPSSRRAFCRKLASSDLKCVPGRLQSTARCVTITLTTMPLGCH